MWSRPWLVSVSMPTKVFSTMSSLCLLYGFLKLLNVFFFIFLSLQGPCSKRLTANAVVATVLGSIPASYDTVDSEGRQMKQC
jgi:hypothetical protein